MYDQSDHGKSRNKIHDIRVLSRSLGVIMQASFSIDHRNFPLDQPVRTQVEIKPERASKPVCTAFTHSNR